jgi:transcriptional regulator with XRE-family HTH domain
LEKLKEDRFIVPHSNLKTETSDFRLRLQGELVRRCKANPKYSLRSFAKFLGIESSRLSKILRGERPVSLILLDKLSRKLGMSPVEVARCRANSVVQKHGLQNEILPIHVYLQLSQDAFESVEDYKHYAILELMKLRGLADFTSADPGLFTN